MKTSSRKKILSIVVLSILVLFIVAYVVVPKIFAHHDASRISIIDTAVNAQKSTLITIADLTRQNNGDSEINAAIVDCKTDERNRFDTLLDTLSKTISPSELTELDSLFFKCADFYSLRKSVMTVRLRHEVAEYSALKKMRNEIEPYARDTSAELQAWQKISDSETKWSSYFNDLVTEQGAIIALFRAGKNASSPEVLTILAEVKNARSQMEILGSQITEYRSSIASI